MSGLYLADKPPVEYEGRTPYPARITSALNRADLYGPDVDVALGGVEPMVDEWETGASVPTWPQLLKLAEMTGVAVGWFFKEPPESPSHGFICQRSGPGKGCSPLTVTVDGQDASVTTLREPDPESGRAPWRNGDRVQRVLDGHAWLGRVRGEEFEQAGASRVFVVFDKGGSGVVLADDLTAIPAPAEVAADPAGEPESPPNADSTAAAGEPPSSPAPEPETAPEPASAPDDVDGPEPDPDDPQTRRDLKASLIARYAWRLGMTADQLDALFWALPYASKSRNRNELTMTRFARDAYEADGQPKGEVNEPSSPDSKSWVMAVQKLAAMESAVAAGNPGGWPIPEQDLTWQSGTWLPPDGVAVGERGEDAPPPPSPAGSDRDHAEPVGVEGGEATYHPAGTTTAAPADSEPWWASLTSEELAAQLPPGWVELAALGPLDEGECIHHPGVRPIVITRDGGRCASCPPMPDEFTEPADIGRDEYGQRITIQATRSGWGARRTPNVPGGPTSVSWHPRLCVHPARCYCGRPCLGDNTNHTAPRRDQHRA
ncbi:MAG TPA: hypothetical protein VFP72_15065, partial [Kineosporiaceae bacterium]|nr:hypothetical protein [Kineosporiaceae bacterium]